MTIDANDWPLDPYTVDGVTLADRLNKVIPSEFNALSTGKANLAGNNTFTGSMNFTGNGRFTADFSNANLGQRFLFQTNVVNGGTVIGAIPNGTATSARFSAFAGPDPINGTSGSITATPNNAAIIAAGLGTNAATFPSIDIIQNSRTCLTFDNSGVMYVKSSAASNSYHGWIAMCSADMSRIRHCRMDNNNDIHYTNKANTVITHILLDGGDFFAAGRLRSGNQGGGEAMFQHTYDAPSGTVGSNIWESSRNISCGLSYFPTGAVACWTPGTDNTTLCGWGFGRWSSVWATNGTIQTSDAREKTPVRHFNDAEVAVAMSLAEDIGFYKWLKDIDEKGEDAQWMCGQTAQFIQARFAEHGLDVLDYGILIYEDYSVYEGVMNPQGKQDEDGNLIEPLLSEGAPRDRWSANYSNLNQFLIRGLRENQLRMEARLAKLEALLKG